MHSVPCAFVAAVDSSDLLKLLLIAGAAVALFVLAKRVGGGGESMAAPLANPGAEPEPEVEAVADASDEPKGMDPDQPGYASPVEDDTPGPPPQHIRLENWNFTKFELESGPPDRTAFADELNMQLYDPSTGRRWMQSYFVATPDGLEQVLRDNKWNYMFIPQLLVIDKYDLKELRAAMLEEFGAVEAQRGEVSAGSLE